MNKYQEEYDVFEENENSFDLKILLPKLIKIWPYYLLSLILFLGLSFYYTKTTSPTYRVSGKFFIKDKENSISLFDKSSVLEDQGIGITNESIILKSSPIADSTLNLLKFDVEYYNQGSFLLEELYKNKPFLVEVDWKSPQLINSLIKIEWKSPTSYSLIFDAERYTQFIPDGPTSIIDQINTQIFNFGEWIETPNFKLKISNTSNEEIGNFNFLLRDKNFLVSKFSGSLNVDIVDKNSSILDLSLIVPNQEKGEAYLNALMQTYLDLELQEKNEISNRTINFIDNQVSGVSDSLTFFENQLQNFRSNNKIYNLSNESNTVFSQLTAIETQLANENLKRRYYQTLKDYLVRENYNEIMVPSGLGIEDPYLNGLIENLLSIQVDRSRLMATQTELSPAVREANKKLSDLNRSIREILENVDLNNSMTIKDLERRKEEIEASFRSLPAAEQNLIRIQRQATLNESIYNFLSEKRAEAAITKASNRPNNKIVEYAKSSGGQINPKPVLNYLVALFLGFMTPIGFVLIRELFRSKIEDIGYLERKLKLPVISTIPKGKTDDNLVVFNFSKAGISESFRSLRANIRFMMPAERQITIMLTSTISGEGKTFCALNLASVYSLTGKKTILIGCDMRKPKIFQDFDIPNNSGLSTLLSGQDTNWKDVVVSTKFDNLDILVSGPIPPNPSELLLTPQFELLLKELKETYDIIILDTPPIGLVSETIDLLNFVDLTLFVFRQNYSHRTFIEALNSLKYGKGLKNVYALFNSVDTTKVNYGYGYTYGYGYGYYDEEKKK
ncbi:polysaccharide biosynthesis tyrosine autokinase [Algoriphagus sp. D3-2-R+10]|uniref:GumC family protein n=1 Tax=Algoriphagus aurantiacus TaxID=3103948 RepID=UPI002B373FB3|nr:polysaccharide biosynthesis tyrosine autokinase [Algoriphagus sp. D3-2-R+10]MEB2777513.1 polysaccharide biosynthesis tyrosine autokinase [Algoriphagus sp. D3-2-R+10]